MFSLFHSGKTYFDDGKPGNFKLKVFKMVVLNMYMRSHSVVESLRAGEKKGSDETLLLYRHEEGDSPVVNFVEMGAVEVNEYTFKFIYVLDKFERECRV